MRRALPFLLTAFVLGFVSAITVQAAGTADSTVLRPRAFETHTVVFKGETMAGLGAVYANLNSTNTEYLLLVNNLDASGALFRIAPQMSFAYKDNAAIGARIVYNKAGINLGNADLNLLSNDLGLSLSDQDLNWSSFGAYVFHRNYIGLEKSGTAGFFCEFRLGYSSNRLDMGGGNCNNVRQAQMAFAPGFILYILPFASVEASIGMADLTYTKAKAGAEGADDGSRGAIGGGVGLKLMNCNFGVSYHF